jgi:hypothetical protein
MNIERFREVQDRIRAHPDLFYMDSFTGLRNYLPWTDQLNQMREYEIREACGTTCCIAGEGAIVAGFAVVKKDGSVSIKPPLQLYDWDKAGELAFDITREQSRKLFYAERWPARFWYRFEKAQTDGNKREQAKIACEVIDDFIKTDGWGV